MTFARTATLALLVASAIAVPAAAVTSVPYPGQDDGAPVGGPFPNSAAAEAAFKAAAAAYGTVKTETFESATLGTLSPLALADLTITTAAPDFGPGLSGVNNITFGSLYGFNVTPGGSNWYGFPNFTATSAIFSFKKPTNSMGLWITGIQSVFTASLTVELIDGSQELFVLPINNNGGAQFFGVVSEIAFSKVLALQTNNPGVADAFGIDDISYNAGVIPEPATWAMLIAGFGLVGAAARRRRGQHAGTVTA